jgi:hypothetical protein
MGMHLIEQSVDPTGPLLDLATRQPIHPWSSATGISAELSPGVIQASASAYQIKQVIKHLGRIAPTPTVQFALHVGDKPSIH